MSPTAAVDPHGEIDPDVPTSPASADDDFQGDPAPEPAGAPPRLNEHQRARLHQLLGQRDADGRAIQPRRLQHRRRDVVGLQESGA